MKERKKERVKQRKLKKKEKKSTQIYELFFYKFMEATKNSWEKGEGRVTHYTITRCFKKFHLGCKTPNNQETSTWLKTMDFETVLQAIWRVAFREYQVNLASNRPMLFVNFINSSKASRAAGNASYC